MLDNGFAGPATLRTEALPFIAPNKLPPRPWAYGTFLQFGQAAVIGAVDGGGKGAIAVAMALAVITGKPLLGEHIWRSGPVAIVSYEDDQTEWQRRIAAACIRYTVDYEYVLANVRFIVKPGGKVSFGTSVDGILISDADDTIAQLDEFRPALVIVDPFNHAHNLEDGNSNVMVAKVAGEMSRVARESKAAVLVLHHLRKGSSGNVDDLMGATSLRATFRSCRILMRMTEDIAEKLDIKDGAWRYIRIAGSKENYAPPPEKDSWLRLASVALNNQTPEYPNGDNLAVAVTWQPRPMCEGMNAETLHKVFNALRTTVHGPTRQAKHTRWAGKVLTDIGERSVAEATRIVKAWLENGILTQGTYYHAASRHEVANVTLDEVAVGALMAQYKSKPSGDTDDMP